MIIENERKYILSSEIENRLVDVPYYWIKQAYLPSVNNIAYRLREVTKNKVKRIFTIKSRNVDGTNTEIEFPVEKEDFDALFSKADRFVNKRRHIVDHLSGTWEIDVFLDSEGKSYFWMAEIELPEHQTEPTSLPDIIKEYLIYEVPLTDGRFSSRKVSSIKYATKLLKHLKGNRHEKAVSVRA